MANGGAILGLVVGVWVACAMTALASRRRTRRRQAWLRSDVPARISYARLRAEIDRRMDEAAPDESPR